MENGCLDIGGKKYLPSAKAAQLVGYTKDYVGQLARAGKIESKLIGRSYYISEDSIRQHKLAVHYTLTQPKKPRKNASRKADITNKKLDSSVVKEGEFKPHVDTAASAVVSEDIDEPENVLVHVDPDERAIATVKSAASSTAHAPAEGRHGRTDPLVRSDVSYERGEPLYYEDTEPVLPQVREKRVDTASQGDVSVQKSDLIRPTGVQGTGVFREQRPPTVVRGNSSYAHRHIPEERPYRQQHGSVRTVSRPTRHEARAYGGGVDGVMPMQRAEPRSVRALRASPTQASRHVGYEEQFDHDEEYAREEQPVLPRERRRSKILPLSIAFAAFVIFVLWYLVF